jgi:hypothetical protein
MKTRQSVIFVVTLLCSALPVVAMDEAASDEVVNAAEMNVAMPEANGDMVAVEEGVAVEGDQLPQAPVVKKPVVAEEAPVVEAAAEEVAVEGDGSNASDVFEAMSREEVADEAPEADHIG